MTFYSPDNLKSILGGTWLARGENGPPRAGEGISTDSRAIKAGQVFIALHGDRTDGHEYLEQVAARHAALAIVDRADALKRPGLIRVWDLRLDPHYTKLRGDPRFEALLVDPKNDAPLF